MSRIFLGGATVCLIVAMRMIFLSEISVIGPIITFGSVIIYFFLASRYAVRCAPFVAPDGPDQGWDPRTIESAKRRADGVE